MFERPFDREEAPLVVERVHLGPVDEEEPRAGIWIPSNVLDSLFSAFHTTKKGGMGIGLFVSHSIIERHAGRLWAESNDGAPGTFSFSIPCRTLGGDNGAESRI